MIRCQLLILAKAPAPGRVKTRLCPPCNAQGAAQVAAAAVADTLDAADQAQGVARRVIVAAGESPLWSRPGWEVVAQRGETLGERIGHAFADTAIDGLPSLLIGMDTPQATGSLLTRCIGLLTGVDAVLGPAADGGWWLLGLNDPARASVLSNIPTSCPDTGSQTRAALVRAGLAVASAPLLRDVDTAADAWAVAGSCGPGARFPVAVFRHVPAPVAA